MKKQLEKIFKQIRKDFKLSDKFVINYQEYFNNYWVYYKGKLIIISNTKESNENLLILSRDLLLIAGVIVKRTQCKLKRKI